MKCFWMNEKGQGVVEYGLIIVLVAVVVLAALTLIGGNVKNILTTVSGSLTAGS